MRRHLLLLQDCNRLKYACTDSAWEFTQNHRMVRVGRDLCGSFSPTLLPKQGHLQQAVEDLVQVGLEYLTESQNGRGWKGPL